MWTPKQLDEIQVHFILCTERTGSSLLANMLNMHPELIVPSEEPFALYFRKKYQHKTHWTEAEVIHFVDVFFALFERNVHLFYEDKNRFLASLLSHRSHLNYERLIKLCYLHFYAEAIKPKEEVKIILDKQMKYVFHQKELFQLFPNAKFIVWTRDVTTNIVAKQGRSIDFFQHPFYLANIWELTYKTCLTLPKASHIIVHFEDLLNNPTETLKTLNAYLGLNYVEAQKNHAGSFQRLIEHRKAKLSSTFVENIKNFHSGLLGNIDKRKLEQGKQSLPKEIQDLVRNKTNATRMALGYAQENNTERFSIALTLKWNFYRWLALLFRPWLWKSYRMLPLQMKLALRKMRKGTTV